MPTAYIVEAVRTAGGKKNGRLSKWHPVALGAAVLDAVVRAANDMQNWLCASETLRTSVHDLCLWPQPGSATLSDLMTLTDVATYARSQGLTGTSCKLS